MITSSTNSVSGGGRFPELGHVPVQLLDLEVRVRYRPPEFKVTYRLCLLKVFWALNIVLRLDNGDMEDDASESRFLIRFLWRRIKLTYSRYGSNADVSFFFKVMPLIMPIVLGTKPTLLNLRLFSVVFCFFAVILIVRPSLNFGESCPPESLSGLPPFYDRWSPLSEWILDVKSEVASELSMWIASSCI